MPYLLLIALAAWAYFGEPSKTVANWFWEYAPAPWETVDAYYYPDRQNLSKHEIKEKLASVEACQQWVSGRAAMNNDAGLVRGDYECGIGTPRHEMGFRVYRATVK